MRTKADLMKGWLLKTESDLASAGMCLSCGQALDTACFHLQQVAEEYSIDRLHREIGSGEL